MLGIIYGYNFWNVKKVEIDELPDNKILVQIDRHFGSHSILISFKTEKEKDYSKSLALKLLSNF